MDTRKLRSEHSSLMALASELGGIAGAARTREDAEQVRSLILDFDALLQAHLNREDSDLYLALMAAPDVETQTLGSAASEEMGGVGGAWSNYRDHWVVETVLADPRRFALATEALIGALSLRIEMENDVLYPAVERLTAEGRRSVA